MIGPGEDESVPGWGEIRVCPPMAGGSRFYNAKGFGDSAGSNLISFMPPWIDETFRVMAELARSVSRGAASVGSVGEFLWRR